MTVSPQPPPQNRSWWNRNWKWFLPVGCLTIVLVFACFIGAIAMAASAAMKSGDVYKESMARASNDPRVTAALGTPVKSGFFVSGNVSVTNDTGNADIAIPLSGPKGKGSIHSVAEKSAGKWEYSTMTASLPDGSSVDLLTSP
jgi:hypothetical protein